MRVTGWLPPEKGAPSSSQKARSKRAFSFYGKSKIEGSGSVVRRRCAPL
jgi:hypothetical protein